MNDQQQQTQAEIARQMGQMMMDIIALQTERQALVSALQEKTDKSEDET